MNFRKLFKIGALLTLSVSVLVGCGGTEESANNSSAPSAQGETVAAEPEEVVISIVGSTTVTPVVEQIAEAYKELNPNTKIEIQGVGSSAGIKAVMEGSADIGMASRELKAGEKAAGLKETAVAHDAIAIVVHPSNFVTGLTTEQAKQIFEGKITNWSEIGGDDAPITVVTREDGSGTRGAFESVMGLVDEDGVSTISPVALVSEGNGAVKASVASKDNSIGFISLGTLDDTTKALEVDGVFPSSESTIAGDYKVSRRLLVLTPENVSSDIQSFLDYALSPEAQVIVSEHYIPVN
ncbi:phosphate-binding protein [Candidatus Epulonipiscium fishelsonii]|uniref:Phosphate-binding protein n=1 Tax=Candidatus Epulonipiscium fishelsonii TaxID=77094 RepID=A0ACC8XA04_9FIRM|nr:phosphate-binding protein [Epulopiscium sp. SCG-B11WGA-EpuloA1]ONI40917.1 phosphate-binding protein [Epulopiscium sp. SCG-B05WGA-EpuloA1]